MLKKIATAASCLGLVIYASPGHATEGHDNSATVIQITVDLADRYDQTSALYWLSGKGPDTNERVYNGDDIARQEVQNRTDFLCKSILGRAAGSAIISWARQSVDAADLAAALKSHVQEISRMRAHNFICFIPIGH